MILLSLLAMLEKVLGFGFIAWFVEGEGFLDSSFGDSSSIWFGEKGLF